MTRLASILGVATVATLVLLSGCESPMKTDYATKLEGTWTNGPSPANFPNQQMPGGTIPGMRTVTATIARDGANKGSFSLTVSDMVGALPAVMSKASGTFEMDGTKITVTLAADGLVLPPGVTLTPEEMAITSIPQDFKYDLTDNDTKLDLRSGVLVVLRVTSSPDEKFTLIKQMANGS